MFELAARMRTAAVELLVSLSAHQRAATVTAFEGAERTEWTYLPGSRPGICLADLTSEQRDLAFALLTASYSPRGLTDAERVVRTEAIRRGLQLDGTGSSPLNMAADLRYWLRFLGDPAGTGPWAWRLSGHHLVANVTVVGDQVAGTPQFFGTEPARVLHGPHRGFRGLPQEEDLARSLVTLLDDHQRRLAIISEQAPFDIGSRYDPVARLPATPGIAWGRLDRQQSELLGELIHQYLDRAAAPIANRSWADILQGGLDTVSFSWAGPTEAGRGHYYAVTGKSFLLEYDNTQDNANHIHTVWRDLARDWAGDLLSRHYGSQHGVTQ